jgi:hypothetical protein
LAVCKIFLGALPSKENTQAVCNIFLGALPSKENTQVFLVFNTKLRKVGLLMLVA